MTINFYDINMNIIIIKTVTGISPNELNKGRKLREIPDLDRAMDTLRKGIKNGMTINGAMDYMENLSKTLHVLKYIRDEKNLKYIKRYKYRHDQAILKQHKFGIGELVAYFIGDRSNRNTNQWWARYQIYKLLRFEHNGNAAVIQSIDDENEQYTVAKSMLVPFKDGSDWMDEMDYVKMVQARKKDMDQNVKKVSFNENEENFEN